jgi:hypothetical protein
VYIGLLSKAKKISSAFSMPYPATLPKLLLECLPEYYPSTLPECLPESYPSALPNQDTLIRPYLVRYLLSGILQEPFTESIACQRYVLQTQLSPCRPNLVYTLPGRQPIFTFTSLLPDLAYLADNPFFCLIRL